MPKYHRLITSSFTQQLLCCSAGTPRSINNPTLQVFQPRCSTQAGASHTCAEVKANFSTGSRGQQFEQQGQNWEREGSVKGLGRSGTEHKWTLFTLHFTSSGPWKKVDIKSRIKKWNVSVWMWFLKFSAAVQIEWFKCKLALRNRRDLTLAAGNANTAWPYCESRSS